MRTTYTHRSKDIQLHLIPAFEDNFIFVLNKGSKFVIVDPGEWVGLSTLFADQNISQIQVLITHHHHDHIGGLDKLMKSFPNAEIFAPSSFSTHFPFQFNAVTVENSIFILDQEVKILSGAGHTADQILYFFKNQKWLFAGDSLFALGCGRIFDGSLEDHWTTLQNIKKLPTETSIFCSHEYLHTNFKFWTQLKASQNGDHQKFHHLLQKIADRQSELTQVCNGAGSSVPLNLQIELLTNPFLLTESFQEFAQLRQVRNTSILAK